MKNPLILNKSSKPAPLLQRNEQSNSHRFCIADILDEEEDNCLQLKAMDERRPRCSRFNSFSLQCAHPRKVVTWLLVALRKARQQQTRLMNEKDTAQFDKGSPSRISVDELQGVDHDRLVSVSGSESGVKESGHGRNDPSFNLGVGCGLLYLIAVSKNELTKMVELRTEMEMLVQNAKEELQMRNMFLEPSKQNHTIACSISDITEGPSSSSQLSIKLDASHCLPGSGICLVDEQSVDTLRINNNVEGMNELESELEAELECLQSQLDRESTFSNTLVMAIHDSPTKGDDVRSSELLRPEEEANPELSCGVSAVELERRLHELLEAKQEERIKELESALECAELKLLEKEIEVTWWKDTAMLMSRHVPQSNRLSSKIKT